MKPAISMKDFFSLPEVRNAQERQKRHFYGSDHHRQAFNEIKRIAKHYQVESYIGEYEN